jgi:hypothetical protein
MTRCPKCKRGATVVYYEPGPYLFLVYYAGCAICGTRTKDCKTPRGAVSSWKALSSKKLEN